MNVLCTYVMCITGSLRWKGPILEGYCCGYFHHAQFKKISLFKISRQRFSLCFTITIVHLHFLSCFFSYFVRFLLQKQPKKCQGAMFMIKQRENSQFFFFKVWTVHETTWFFWVHFICESCTFYDLNSNFGNILKFGFSILITLY